MSTGTADAQTAPACSFTFNPTPSQSMDDLQIKITSNQLVGGLYRFHSMREGGGVENQGRDVSFKGETTLIFKKKPSGWVPGKYSLDFAEQSQMGDIKNITTNACHTSFIITEKGSQVSCTTGVENQTIEPDTKVLLNIKNLEKKSYVVHVNDKEVTQFTVTTDNIDTAISLGKFGPGKYIVAVKNWCGSLGAECLGKPQALQCPLSGFWVGERGSGGGGAISPGVVAQGCKPGESGCSSSAGISCDPGTGKAGSGGVLTAIWCVPTEPTALIQAVLKMATMAGGGIALLLMIFGAFQMITSAGNPEGVKKGHEQMTSAVIGLLFIIFSTLLLKVIGVDILNIPGFSP